MCIFICKEIMTGKKEWGLFDMIMAGTEWAKVTRICEGAVEF